ncbi:MAG: hypothetical protein F4W90_01220 [Gammaproteobacteria bacterium]|nr:hypothetical protein [Gammaproteobacteria bacterium]
MADPYVGKTLSESQFTIDDGVLNDYLTGLKLESNVNDQIPVMVATGIDNAYFAEIAFPYQIGHLWMRQEWELHRPLVSNYAYQISGQITDIYDKRDRQVVKYRVDMADEGGDLVVRTYHHQSFLRERISGDSVELRDPSKKPGARKFIVPEGKRFGGFAKVITKEMCGLFFHGNANYHTDDEAAKELGFQRVVVGGRMTMAYAGTVLEDYFGDAWATSGKLDLKFTNPCWCDDLVTVHGVELATQTELDRRQAFLWMQKEDDSIVYVAEASVAV